jgi:transcriptional regulator with XRE-family HTH domain
MRHAEALHTLNDAEARIARGLGQRIRMFRRLQQLTLAEVGGRLGLSGQMVHKYESGQSQLPASRLPRLAAALGVSTHLLLPGLAAGADARGSLSAQDFVRRIDTLLGHGAHASDEPVH